MSPSNFQELSVFIHAVCAHLSLPSHNRTADCKYSTVLTFTMSWCRDDVDPSRLANHTTGRSDKIIGRTIEITATCLGLFRIWLKSMLSHVSHDTTCIQFGSFSAHFPLQLPKLLPHALNTQGVCKLNVFLFFLLRKFHAVTSVLPCFAFCQHEIIKNDFCGHLNYLKSSTPASRCIQDSKCFLLQELDDLFSCCYFPASCIGISKHGPARILLLVFSLSQKSHLFFLKSLWTWGKIPLERAFLL